MEQEIAYPDGLDYKIGSLDLTGTGDTNTALRASELAWTFGRGWYGGKFTDHITGYLDNIRFSNTALTPDQLLGAPSESIQWLYGDFTGNHFVDLDDYTIFSKLWLKNRLCWASTPNFN